MSFRAAILKRVERQLCKLIIDDPDKEFQNEISGYEKLDDLRFGDSMNPISSSGSGSSYLAPRIPNERAPGDYYNTALRSLHCRPIKNFDVTGLRPQRGRPMPGHQIEGYPPQAFLHIISGEKDVNEPDRKDRSIGRLVDQIEYLKIAIDCVIRNEAEPDSASQTVGNGEYWWEQTQKCQPIDPLPEIVKTAAIPPSGGNPGTPAVMYRPQYHKTINEQAVGFVEDIESLLDPNALVDVYEYGAGKQARVLDTSLVLWGMLPNSENSPTDTVRCMLNLELHYPKNYNSPC